MGIVFIGVALHTFCDRIWNRLNLNRTQMVVVCAATAAAAAISVSMNVRVEEGAAPESEENYSS